jgi:hypothetical protein
MKTRLNDIVPAKEGINLVFNSLLFLFLLTNNLLGQTADTVIISADPPGNLNNVINNDTTLTGEHTHRVYLLKNDGQTNSIYYLTEPIIGKDITLIGKNNPNTNFPPVIAPYINEDNSSVGTFIKIEKGGIVNFENLYLLGTRIDNISVTQNALTAMGENVTFNIDYCIFENFGATGTPNILNTWNAIGSKIFISNSLFRNNQSNVPNAPGMNWAGPGVNAIDTMIVKNSTFFVLGGNIEGSGTSIGYLEFDHNTMFMQTQSSPFIMKQMCNVRITNNIFYSVYSAGLDSLRVSDAGIWSFSYNKPAIIELDSLHGDLEGDPYYLVEADRIIKATNNVYFWSKTIQDNFDTLNSDSKYQVVGGRILSPVWVTTKPGAESILTDRDSWPSIDVYTNNDSIDPGFDADLVQATSDSMARFVRHVWENGDYGTGLKPFVYLSDPNNMFVDVPQDWAEIKGYPVRENLRYSNQSLITAGTDGLPLGDINWFPEYNVNVEETQESLMESFYLSQNYPNPFNPSTTISFTLSEDGKVQIKIFDVLGREVSTLIDRYVYKGKHSVVWNGRECSSGVYFYSITYKGQTINKKMLLVK